MAAAGAPAALAAAGGEASMEFEIREPHFREVIDEGSEFEKLATGFGFIEGPVWHAEARCLIFSDIPGDRQHRWRPPGAVEVFREPSGMANGNALDRDGRLVTCEHATSRLVRR